MFEKCCAQHVVIVVKFVARKSIPLSSDLSVTLGHGEIYMGYGYLSDQSIPRLFSQETRVGETDIESISITDNIE